MPAAGLILQGLWSVLLIFSGTYNELLDYVMFVTFFPELIAGPIVRASVFLPQMSTSIGPTRERLALGGSAFLLGRQSGHRFNEFVPQRQHRDPVLGQHRIHGFDRLFTCEVCFGVQV